jgi:hypothetical protein
MKLVELEILGVIWQKQFEFENLGGATVTARITAGHRAAWAPASRRAAFRPFSRALDHHLVRARAL